MASLPHDVIIDILCLSSVRDLLRFRCISKPVCSSIDDPDFINRHLSHSLETNSNRALILHSIRVNQRNKNPPPKFRECDVFSVNFDSLDKVQRLNHPLDESDEGKYIEIFGSCNGLVALCNEKWEISLWNPSTRKSRMLPFPGIESPPQGSCLDSYVYGFGYDPTSDDYKVVRVVQYDTLDSEVKVYSLKTNSWRRITDFPFHLGAKRASGILANNALHWVVSETTELYSQVEFIVALDLETEEYHVVELPDGLDDGFWLILRAMGGCLCVNVSYDWGPPDVDTWMMKEYGIKESWTKLTSLKKSESMPDLEYALPLAFSKNGDKVLLDLIEKKLVWYDMATKRADRLIIKGLPRRFFVEMMVESLVPLDSQQGETT